MDGSSTAGRFLRLASPPRNAAISLRNSSSDAAVSMTRYLSTKAATPRARSHSATSVPSLCQDRKRNPPPGQMTTAAPVAIPGWGRKAVRVGVVTLRTITFLSQSLRYSTSFCVQPSEPGAGPGQIEMTVGLAIDATLFTAGAELGSGSWARAEVAVRATTRAIVDRMFLVICDGIDARAGTCTQIMLEWMHSPVKFRSHSTC